MLMCAYSNDCADKYKALYVVLLDFYPIVVREVSVDGWGGVKHLSPPSCVSARLGIYNRESNARRDLRALSSNLCGTLFLGGRGGAGFL